METFVIIIIDSNPILFWTAFYYLIIITDQSNGDTFSVLVFWAFKAIVKAMIEMENLEREVYSFNATCGAWPNVSPNIGFGLFDWVRTLSFTYMIKVKH